MSRERIQTVLKQITAEPALEARWLHTLSLLEFVGARKISRTVAERHPSLEVLGHLADETRHALAFKRLACEVAGGQLSEYLCPQEAATYFQTLDRELAAWATQVMGQEDVKLHYLLTTTLVEQRAMLMYPLYKAATQRASVRAELGQVVTEEQSHRLDIEETCKRQLAQAGVADLSVPRAIEQRLFDAFLSALEREVAGEAEPQALPQTVQSSRSMTSRPLAEDLSDRSASAHATSASSNSRRL